MTTLRAATFADAERLSALMLTGLEDKTNAVHREQIEKSAAKRQKKPFEWPPKGIVLYDAKSRKKG